MTSGGWKDSDRKRRLPPNWARLVEQTMARCGRRCEVREPSRKTEGLNVRCWRRATDVDHIVAGDDHSLSNLQGICTMHHRAKSAQEGVEGRRRAASKRETEAHPGVKS